MLGTPVRETDGKERRGRGMKGKEKMKNKKRIEITGIDVDNLQSKKHIFI